MRWIRADKKQCSWHSKYWQLSKTTTTHKYCNTFLGFKSWNAVCLYQYRRPPPYDLVVSENSFPIMWIAALLPRTCSFIGHTYLCKAEIAQVVHSCRWTVQGITMFENGLQWLTIFEIVDTQNEDATTPWCKEKMRIKLYWSKSIISFHANFLNNLKTYLNKEEHNSRLQ